MMRTRSLALVLIAAMFGAIAMTGHDQPERAKPTLTNHLEPFAFFLGSWLGSVDNMGREGTIRRTYTVVLDGNFVQFKTRADFDIGEDGVPAEVHQDWGMVSFDNGRDTMVVREFHTEGFVNQYVVKSISEDGRKIVLETESVENGPPGLRARLTLQVLEENEFEETFELASGDEPYRVCVSAQMHRMMTGGF